MGQLNNYTYTFTPGTKAESDQVNQNFKDIKNAHNATDTAAFYKDGTKAMTGDADMGSNKVTTMADGTAATDAVNKGQLDGVDVLSAKGDLLTFSTVNARKAIGSNDQILVPDSSETDGLKWTGLGNLSKYLSIQNIKNLISQNDADPDHDVNFYRPDTNYPAQVIIRDASFNTRTVNFSGEMTKQTNATWAVGDDAGGLDENDALTADTFYNGFLLYKSSWVSGEDPDFGFTTDPTGASLLTDAAVIAEGFDEISVKPIGFEFTDSSANILPSTRIEKGGGDLFASYTDAVKSVDATASTGNRTLYPIAVPPGFSCCAQLVINQTTTASTQYGILSSPYESDVAPSASTLYNVLLASNAYVAKGLEETCIQTDESSQVGYRSTLASNVIVYTKNYTVSR